MAADTLTITHTHAGGTVLEGTSRGDGSAEVLRTRPGHSYWKWSRNLGAWYVPQSRDRISNRYAIDKTADALRVAGFEVEVTVDDSPRATAEVMVDRQERAEDRAERMHDRAERHQAASDAARAEFRRIGDAIPMGQPILVGHHSERRHRKALARQDRALQRTVEEHQAAEYAAHRAELAEREAAGTESRTTTANRVERLTAEVRKLERIVAGEQWAYTDAPKGDEAERFAALLAQAQDQLTYWEGVLAQKPAAVDPTTVAKGDLVQWRGREWMLVIRVNKKSVTVPSIVGGTWTDTVPWQKITGHKPAQESPAPVELDNVG